MKVSLALLILPVLLGNCTHPQKKDIKSDMIVSAVAIDTGIYSIHIFIPRRIRENLEQKIIENLMYRPDSSIYHLDRTGKVSPLYVETIANPDKNVIEYLVEFNREVAESPNLFYADKYINFRTYPLKLK